MRDSEHNLPLHNVEVFMEVGYDCFNPLCFPAGSCSYSLPDRNRKTDDEGDFFFAPQIHMAHHWICWSRKIIQYSKPGYLRFRDIDPWFYKNIHLDLWTHSLNSKYYSGPLLGYRPMTSDQLDKLGFAAVDEKGVFYRRPGSSFTKIFHHDSSIWEKGFFFNQGSILTEISPHASFFDENSNTWSTLDYQGKEFVPKVKPPGDLRKIISKCGSLFTDGKKIFIRSLKNEVKTITPHEGNISYVFHDGMPYYDFYSIEGDGSMICHYGNSRALSHFYNTKLEKKLYDIYFFKAYDSSVLSSNSEEIESAPDSPMERGNKNSSLDHMQFIKIEKLDSRKFLLLTKTPLNWHIYQMEWCWKGNTEKYQLEFTELACFSIKREILALTYGWHLFISFKNEGIRKFEIKNGQLLENKKFYERSHFIITADILGISPGYPYVYAVSGEDKIYRFSNDGWPDYPIQLKSGLKQALEVPHNLLYEKQYIQQGGEIGR